MTNEEAKEYWLNHELVDDKEQSEAVWCAIEALKKPEIVYCRDCKYYTTDNKGYCTANNGLRYTDGNLFCSSGEKENKNERNNKRMAHTTLRKGNP